MHPALSLIVFTSASGLGFGMLFWIGLAGQALTGWHAFFAYCLAYLFSIIGLVSSTTHLGNPQRALKAFSQWRSSWLSREGCVAVLTLMVFALTGFFQVFLAKALPLVMILGAVLALITVYCTAMIYAQLKTVPRWNSPFVPVLFVTYALAGGALANGLTNVAPGLIALAAVIQLAYWIVGSDLFKGAGSTMETATGLGDLGKVRLLEKPHSGRNYLTTEMVHVVARKHATKLQVYALILSALVPILGLLFVPDNGIVLAVAVAFHLAGVMVSRWLFFAQAEHVVGLYYGQGAR